MNKKPLSGSRESVGGYTKYIRNGGSASLCGFVRTRASQVEQGGFVMLKGLICNHCAGAKQGLKGAHARKRKLPVGVHTHFNHVLHVGSFFFYYLLLFHANHFLNFCARRISVWILRSRAQRALIAG